MNFRKNTFTFFAFASAAFSLCGCNLISSPEPTSTEAAPAEKTQAAAPAQAAKTAEQPKDTASANTPATAAEKPTTTALSKKDAEKKMKEIREEIEKIQLEKSEIEAKLALANTKRDMELLPLQLEKQELDAARSTRAALFSEKLNAMEEERARIERGLALANARLNVALREKQRELTGLETSNREIQLELAAVRAKYSNPAEILAKKQELANVATNAQPKYLKEPFVNGTLYISDRRIEFDGPVTADSAAAVINKISFFNNKSTEYPIFLVITNSPGGSVAAGYQIQKAMQSSKAPVYVLVKGMAASMAAVIATTAERSFCFANTMMLHHQISVGFPQSNLTVLRESVADTTKWYNIFAAPVAKKMGITVDEFTKLMYKHNSRGDWVEYGESAVKWKWIDQLVDRVEETAQTSIPAAARPAANPFNPFGQAGLVEKTDKDGKRYVELPPLSNPLDCWWIYDANGYYRTR